MNNDSQLPARPEPEWYLNLREFRVEVTPGDVPGTVRLRRTLDRSFREAIQEAYVDKAKEGKVIDI